MDRPTNSFEIMPDLQRRMPRLNSRWLWAWRLWYGVRAVWRHVRVSNALTRLLGPQYRRSRDLIEIDITYFCNLHCLNCNRSVTQAPEPLHMSVEQVARFVDDSLARETVWRRIRVLGGEPTLHPEFPRIIEELLRYQASQPDAIVEVVTNGYGARVRRALGRLPATILIDNSAKDGPVQPTFGPFNLAPLDDSRYRMTNFANGCVIAEDCGMGLTPAGYYPCAVAGGIDRILRANLGRVDLPDDDDDLLSATEQLCGLCGRFRSGHFVPRLLRSELTDERISPTWERLYREWRRHMDQRAPEAMKGATLDNVGTEQGDQ